MDVLDLSYDDAEFDAVYSVQVLEYIPNVIDALRQIARVLKPGGRLVAYATNWSSVVWASRNRERAEQILKAWEQHAPHTDLPTLLSPQLREAGLQPTRRLPTPILNTSYHPNSYSYWLAKGVRLYLVGRGLASAEAADAWLAELDALDREGAYFFCSTPILTEAIKLA
jgi:SAM-dependent methyltransferase